MSEFRAFRSHIVAVRDSVNYVATALDFWALHSCYLRMITFVQEAKRHPGLSAEIIRAPSLLTNFVAHLRENEHRHLDLNTGSLFNFSFVAPPGSWREWQEAGYKNRNARTAANYDSRLDYFIGIFEGRNPKGIYYPQVIAQRDQGFGGEAIPYWYLWNYGNFGGQSGYPAYGGLHFIERAEALVPTYREQARVLLDRYLDTAFDTNPSIPSVLTSAEFKRAYGGFSRGVIAMERAESRSYEDYGGYGDGGDVYYNDY